MRVGVWGVVCGMRCLVWRYVVWRWDGAERCMGVDRGCVCEIEEKGVWGDKNASQGASVKRQ